MKATHRGSHKVKGWRHRAPHLRSERREVMARCGSKAFLQPKKLAFPIVAKHGSCAPDCDGLRVAYARAEQFGHKKVAGKAHRKARAARCAWVR